MKGKYSEEVKALQERGIDIYRPIFHRQYEDGLEGYIRRQYMDLATPPFYPKVFEVVDINPFGSVLDLGCGNGTDIINLRKNGHQGHIVGVETPVSEDPDATEDKIELIKQNVAHAGFGNFEVKIGYAEDIDFPAETFDTVWAANVLQEVSDIDKVLDRIFMLLKPGGRLIAVTNHKDNKPFHHAILHDMADQIGAIPPKPFSSKFNSVTGPQTMSRHRHQFRQEHMIIQQGRKNLKITQDEIPYLLASLSSYWPAMLPKKVATGEYINKAELDDFMYLLFSKRDEILREIGSAVAGKIESSPTGAVYETIKRVALVYRKRSKTGHMVLKTLQK